MAKILRGKSFKRKTRLSLFWTFLLFCWGIIPSTQAVVDRIVAIVNQEIITLSEVERWMGPFHEEIQTEDRLEKKEKLLEARRKILEQIIEEKLIDQEVRKIGFKASPKEVEATIEEIKKRNNATQEDLENALARDGLTFEAFKREIEKRILRARFISVMIKVDSKFGDKELLEFYKKNLDRYRRNEVYYRPAHILFIIPKEGTPEEVSKIRKKCETVLEKIKKGEDFGEMALLYSEDASSKDRGDLGYFKKGELLPAFEKEALRLRVGEVSGIIRTEHGFHIIKLLDRKGGDPAPFEEIKEKVKADYMEIEMEKALRQFLTKLKEKSIIEIKL